jgi:ferredoxin-thioredoxin reductase catalytic subunit
MGLFSKKGTDTPNSEPQPQDVVNNKYTMPWLLSMAGRYKLTISDDTQRVSQILGSLPKTGGQCPCVPKYAHSDDTICPCTQMRIDGICHCGLYKDRPVPTQHSETTIVGVRRNGTDVQTTYMGAELVPTSGHGDDQTLIIQYDRSSDLSTIRNIVRRYKNKSASAYIDRWRDIDTFVNLDDTGLRGKPWVRIVYECLDDNPDPSPINGRFPGGYIIHVSRTLDRPNVTLDTLLEGR